MVSLPACLLAAPRRIPLGRGPGSQPAREREHNTSRISSATHATLPPPPLHPRERSSQRTTLSSPSPRPKDPSPSFLPRPIPPVTNTALFLALRCRAYHSPARFRPYPRQGPRSPSPSHHHCQRLCRLHTSPVDVGTRLAQPEEEDQRHTHLKCPSTRLPAIRYTDTTTSSPPHPEPEHESPRVQQPHQTSCHCRAH